MESTKVSYVNNRSEFKVALVSDELVEQVVYFDENQMLYFYDHPIDKSLHPLHSLADKPALVEPYGREHWMWHGVLHRTSGPAFVCDGNPAGEYSVFGVSLSDDRFYEFQEYFLKLEAFALSNGIDLHKGSSHADWKDKFLDFKSEGHLLLCAKNGLVPITERHTSEQSLVELKELVAEVKSNARGGGGLLAAGLLGVTAALAAKAFKSKSKRHPATVSKSSTQTASKTA